MRSALIAAVAALSLGSCALPILPAVDAIDRAVSAFGRIERAADVVVPMLPPERQVRARAVLASIAIALEAARSATAPAERDAAIARADAQLAQLNRALRR